MSEENVNTGQAGDPTAEKDPSDWVTGGEPATGAQKSYLSTLMTLAGRVRARSGVPVMSTTWSLWVRNWSIELSTRRTFFAVL